MTIPGLVVVLAALLGVAAGVLTQWARPRSWRLKLLVAVVSLAILTGLYLYTLHGGTIIGSMVFTTILTGSYAFMRPSGQKGKAQPSKA